MTNAGMPDRPGYQDVSGKSRLASSSESRRVESSPRGVFSYNAPHRGHRMRIVRRTSLLPIWVT